jgi:hypothetical protein
VGLSGERAKRSECLFWIPGVFVVVRSRALTFARIRTRTGVIPAKSDTVARVRAIALKLPDVEEGTTHGYAAFKLDDKAFAWFPKKKEVEPGALAVRMSILERDHRMRAAPDKYYVTPHYKDYPATLVRAELLSAKELTELLESGYEFMVSLSRRPTSPRPRRA